MLFLVWDSRRGSMNIMTNETIYNVIYDKFAAQQNFKSKGLHQSTLSATKRLDELVKFVDIEYKKGALINKGYGVRALLVPFNQPSGGRKTRRRTNKRKGGRKSKRTKRKTTKRRR